MRHLRLTLLAAAFASCAASPWRAPSPDLPRQVGACTVYEAPSCLVLASTEDAAEEALEFYDALAESVRAATGRPAPRPLVLALAFEDPLPVMPAEAYVTRLAALHQQVTGVPREVRQMQAPKGEDGRDLEVDPTWAAKLVAFAAPCGDETLGLPAILRERTDFVIVLPTTTCLEEVASGMLDAALDAKEASFFERAVILPLRGTITGQLVDTMLPRMRIDVLAAMLPKSACTEAELADACGRLGVAPEDVRGADTPGPSEAEAAATQAALERIRLSSHDPRLATGATVTPLLVECYCCLSYTHFVDASPEANAEFAAAARAKGKHYVHFPSLGGVPDRVAAEAFAAALPSEPKARVLVVGAKEETAPLLVASHAYYVARVGRKPAIREAIDLGVGVWLAEFARSLPAGEEPDPQRR